MREILFRGKRIDGHRDNTENGTMLYGSLFIDKKGLPKIKWYDEHFGTSMTSNVDPETIGQYTGFVDMNGAKIFEGDVLQLEDDIIGVVYFNHGCFFLTEYGLRGEWTESGYDECGGGWGVIDREPMHFLHISKLEVIGNIHDNLELLEVQ